ncbi:MAG TPA: hypothetical protein VIL90_05750 [Puia sp.]
MDKAKKILIDLTFFISDISLLLFKILRQTVFPNKRRKGNLLSSIFLFFMAFAERVVLLRNSVRTILQLTPFMRGHKYLRYLRQGFILVTCLLFVISLFEWTPVRERLQAIRAVDIQNVDQSKQIANEPVSEKAKSVLSKNRSGYRCEIKTFRFLTPEYTYRPSQDLYLLFQVFRI